MISTSAKGLIFSSTAAEGFVVVGAASDAIQALQMIDGLSPTTSSRIYRMPEHGRTTIQTEVQDSKQGYQFIMTIA
jgi:hypothetical protein